MAGETTTTTTKIKGRDVNIGGFAFGTSCDLTITVDLEQKGGTSSKWKEYTTVRKGWKMSCQGILGGTIADSVGTSQSVSFTYGTTTRSGTGIITSAKYAGNVKGYSTYNVEITGTGALS